MIDSNKDTISNTSESALSKEEDLLYQAILGLNKASLSKIIHAFNAEFGAQQESAGADEEETKVETKKSFKINIKNLGEGTKIAVIKIFQGLFPGTPLSQLMSMYKAGEIDREFLDQEEAKAVLEQFKAIGKGLEAELV